MKQVKSIAAAAVSVSLFLVGPVGADDAKTQSNSDRTQVKQAETDRRSRPLLSGPRVEERAQRHSRVDRMGEQQQTGAGPIRPMAWIRMARSLDLTESQLQQIDQLVTRFREAQQQFHAEHQEAIEALRRSLQQARKEQDRAGAREALGQFQALRAQGPNPERLQRAIWGVLTAAQQEKLQERIAHFRKQREEQMRQQRLDRGNRPGVRGAESEEAVRSRQGLRRQAVDQRSQVRRSNDADEGISHTKRARNRTIVRPEKREEHREQRRGNRKPR